MRADKSAELMRCTWDAAARTENRVFVGSSEHVEEQVENVLALVGARRRGAGTCLEVGCGDGRMTNELARRWRTVIAVDISPEMLRRAASKPPANVRFQLVSGVVLDGVPDSCAEQLMCYGVLQHFPSRRLIRGYMNEFARVLAPGGEAIVHVPVMHADPGSRLWRIGRRFAITARSTWRSDFSTGIAYMGARLTESELAAILNNAGLHVAARTELGSYFKRSRNVILRLTLHSEPAGREPEPVEQISAPF